MASPAFSAWKLSGMPEPIEEYSKYKEWQRCSHCGQDAETVRIKRIASNRFTNWDSYSNDDKPVWCNSCIWSFTEQSNRTEAIYVSGNILYQCYQVQSFKPLLMQPMDEQSFLSAALKKNKHVLPYAQWGKIQIEDISLQWRQKEINWLMNIERLVDLGFLIGDIKNDVSPSFKIVSKLSSSEITEAYQLWESISPLRKLIHLFNFILELNKKSTMEYQVFTLK